MPSFPAARFVLNSGHEDVILHAISRQCCSRTFCTRIKANSTPPPHPSTNSLSSMCSRISNRPLQIRMQLLQVKYKTSKIVDPTTLVPATPLVLGTLMRNDLSSL